MDKTRRGGGKSCAYANGNFLEKGVNFSDVQASLLQPHCLIVLIYGSLSGIGVSIVFHPINPHVPQPQIFVFFQQRTRRGRCLGLAGFDLTPYYPIPVSHLWHQQAKDCCDKYDQKFYKKFKTQCDEYFYLPHREETRSWRYFL